MRATIDIDDDLLRLAKHLAQERAQSLGRVLSDLIRRGIQPPVKAVPRRGVIPVLPRKEGAGPVTAQDVKDLLESQS